MLLPPWLVATLTAVGKSIAAARLSPSIFLRKLTALISSTELVKTGGRVALVQVVQVALAQAK